MKIKFKLSIMVIIIVTVIITGIAGLLLIEARKISRDLSLRGIKYLANDQATYWKGYQNAEILVLRTLANVMSEYESFPPAVKRVVAKRSSGSASASEVALAGKGFNQEKDPAVKSKAKYVLADGTKPVAVERVKALLDRFPVYPQLDLALLKRAFVD